MDVVDYEELSEEDLELIIDEADPCEDCGSKEHLVVGVVTSGEDFGEYLVLCSQCHLDFNTDKEMC